MNIVANVLTNARFAGWVLTATIIFVCVAGLNSPEQRKDNRDAFVVIIVTLFYFAHMFVLCVYD